MPPPPPPPPPPPIAAPRNPGDVVGRDLSIPGFGFLGHIGIHDGSNNVYQVMNEASVVQKVSWDNFRSQDTPWPTLYPAIPNHTVKGCYADECIFWDPPFGQQYLSFSAKQAMVERARQIQQIGADYTLTTSVIVAEPRMYDQRAGRRFPAIRGKYRCDTFVMDAFSYSHAIVGGGRSYDILGFPTRLWRESVGQSQDWANRINGLIYMPGITPVQVYNRIGSFQ